MFRRVVCFRLHEDKKDQVEEAKRQFLTLKAIPEVVDLEVGIDESRGERSYDFTLIVDFEDQAGLDVYDNHDLHQPVRKFIRSVSESIVVVDYTR